MMVMRRIGLEFILFGIGSILFVVACIFGLVGGIINGEAFSPMFFLGLIFSLTVLVTYGFVLLFRTIRWIITKVHRRPSLDLR